MHREWVGEKTEFCTPLVCSKLWRTEELSGITWKVRQESRAAREGIWLCSACSATTQNKNINTHQTGDSYNSSIPQIVPMSSSLLSLDELLPASLSLSLLLSLKCITHWQQCERCFQNSVNHPIRTAWRHVFNCRSGFPHYSTDSHCYCATRGHASCLTLPVIPSIS